MVEYAALGTGECGGSVITHETCCQLCISLRLLIEWHVEIYVCAEWYLYTFQDPGTFATFLDEQKTIQLIHRVLKGKTHAANSFAAHAAESKLALDKNIATASNI